MAFLSLHRDMLPAGSMPNRPNDLSPARDRARMYPDSALQPLLQRIDPPVNQARLSISQFATWCTWSSNCLKLLRSWTEHLRSLPRPRRKVLFGGTCYNYTLSVSLDQLDPGFAKDFIEFARALYELPTPSGLLLLTGVFGDFFESTLAPQFASLLREALVLLSRDPLSALYVPLEDTIGVSAGDFPLHADLYLPELLLNIFEDVPPGPSGKSLFLSRDAFLQMLHDCKELPPEVEKLINTTLSRPLKTDGYEEFFATIHGQTRPAWRARLQREMRSHALRIKLSKGQGYLLHDRSWLHGRERPAGAVSRKRLHRLVFNNRERQEFRIAYMRKESEKRT